MECRALNKCRSDTSVSSGAKLIITGKVLSKTTFEGKEYIYIEPEYFRTLHIDAAIRNNA
jgi:hypothetical protein